MIDIHAHLIPGVDDGSVSFFESVRMLEMACQRGVRALVATPHSNIPIQSNYYGEWFENCFKKLQELTKEIPITLYKGMEIYLTKDVVDLVKDNKLITINNTRYILIELPVFDTTHIILTNIKSIINANLIPIIAHPERYELFHDDTSLLMQLASQGCIFQINKGSILGQFGATSQKLAKYMLKHGLVHVIASDAHSPYQRTTRLDEAYDYICYRYGTDYAKTLFYINPGRILKDENIDRWGLL